MPGGQVWRLAQDGQVLTPITSEPMDISALDVNPMDGTLAFVSNNQLLLADADGGNRWVVVPNDPLPADWSEEYWTKQLSNPRWSPDGTRLAYGLDGVNVLDIATGESARWLGNKTSPEVELYFPYLWSPDGGQLMVEVRFYESSSFAVLDAHTRRQKPTFAGGLGGGRVAWSNDPDVVYVAIEAAGYNLGPGMWQVNVRTGQETLLFGGEASLTTEAAGWPWVAPDGHLFYFYGEGGPGAYAVPLKLASSAADGVTNRRLVQQTDLYYMDDVLWASDGSLAVTYAAASVDGGSAFWLLPGDGRLPVRFDLWGQVHDLCWGQIPAAWHSIYLTPTLPTATPTPWPTPDTSLPVISAQNVAHRVMVQQIDPVLYSTKQQASYSPEQIVFWPDAERFSVQSGWGLAEVRDRSGVLQSSPVGMDLSGATCSALSVDGRFLAVYYDQTISLLELPAGRDGNSYWIATRACRNLVKKEPQRVRDALGVDEYHYKERHFYRSAPERDERWTNR